MRFALWSAGIFFALLSVRVGWKSAAIAMADQPDPLVYGLAMQQVELAALFLIVGAILISAGCFVAKADGGKH